MIDPISYKNSKGQYHREDGPALIFPSGAQHWYKNDKRHREDGPAILYSDGAQEWFINDKLHREDGPAVVCPNGVQEWWLDDKKYTEPEFYKELHRRGKITKKELFIHLL